jgi:hypothetical protein
MLLSVAAALEAAFADDPELGRPRPDLSRLADAPPLSATPGFLAWD